MHCLPVSFSIHRWQTSRVEGMLTETEALG
jgi:hypothetical protein